MGMPSVHAIPLVLLTLVATVHATRRGLTPTRAIGLGVLMGIAILHHSLSGIIVSAAICLMLLASHALNRTLQGIRSTIVAGGVAALISAPYLLPNLLRPKLNPIPLRYIAPEFGTLEYALFIPNVAFCVFFWGFLLIGIVALSRRIRQQPILLLFCCLAVTVAGQLLGYVQLLATSQPDTFGFVKGLPYLLPHEFQWFFQLFALIPTAYGIAQIGKMLLGKRHLLSDLALPLLLIVPGYINLPQDQLRNLVLHLAEKPAYIRWIEENTPKDAVFVTSHAWDGYRAVQPFTARKILYHYPAHMNFNVDIVRRGNQKGRLLYHADKAEADRIVLEYNLSYALLDKTKLPANRAQFFNETFPTVYEEGMFVIHRFGNAPEEANEREQN